MPVSRHRHCRPPCRRGTRPRRAARDPRAPAASHGPRPGAARRHRPMPAAQTTFALDRAHRRWVISPLHAGTRPQG
jgi:hypothetical protein